MSRLNRFEWLKAVLQVKDLKPSAQVVAAALSVQFANDETGQINPAVKTLAEYLHMSLATVKRAIKELVAAGWLHRTEGRGAGNRTRYKLLAPCKIATFRPKNPKKKGAQLHLSDQEKGSSVTQKGVSPEPSYKEQSKKQKARLAPSPDLPIERQSGETLRFVPGGGGYFEREWDDALRRFGLPTLSRGLPQVIEDGRKGYVLPDLMPASQTNLALHQEQIKTVKRLMEAHARLSNLAVAA